MLNLTTPNEKKKKQKTKLEDTMQSVVQKSVKMQFFSFTY